MVTVFSGVPREVEARETAIDVKSEKSKSERNPKPAFKMRTRGTRESRTSLPEIRRWGERGAGRRRCRAR